jgi:cysteinyl-tRNA synthetase
MKQLEIFNTEGREIQEFKPLEPDKVLFYQCGPTVYWTQHIGNMRAMVLADLVNRSLRYFGYDVKFVRNYTDVGHLTGDNIGDADSGEDRMAKAARREHSTPEAIAEKYIAQFEGDLSRLNTLQPEVKPRASHYIAQMQKLVEDLYQRGFAYATDQAIYFDVSKAQDYTRLSGQKLELNQQGAGKGDVSDPGKRNAQDFSLWFFKVGPHANALQVWEFPSTKLPQDLPGNGLGFPGWHIECSAMAAAELGQTIDLHMGGIEHIPVHHTNEIAQSESAFGKKFVNYWIHNEHLTVDGGKMSKSEGTAYSVAELEAKGFDPLALRYFFLQSHYRSKQNFTDTALEAAETSLNRLRKQVTEFAVAGYKQGSVLEVWRLKFSEALASDFNFPQALAVAWELLKSDAAPEDKLETLLDFDRVLGLKLADAQTATTETSELLDPALQQLLSARDEARAKKDWAAADNYRGEIVKKFGGQVMDGPDGQSKWQR